MPGLVWGHLVGRRSGAPRRVGHVLGRISVSDPNLVGGSSPGPAGLRGQRDGHSCGRRGTPPVPDRRRGGIGGGDHQLGPL